eukprot:TRINITY_DN47557_c0_g1_i2.p1 TRINITY_DN47557_c0_g1~~TRINITY_DN47557_c0_g1_i2.p1  ORF type:complete len:566 (+),score=21.57 TRINITY_DN47557_c0_g1_i2:417-2114(+)
MGALQAFRCCHLSGLEADTTAFNAALSACGAASAWAAALTFMGLVRSLSCQAETLTYNTLITAVGSSTWQGASAMLDAVRSEGHELGVEAVNAAAAQSASAHVWKSALMFFWVLPRSSLQADTITRNCAVDAASKVGRWGTALNLISASRAVALATDSITFGAFTSRGAQWQIATHLVRNQRELEPLDDETALTYAYATLTETDVARIQQLAKDVASKADSMPLLELSNHAWAFATMDVKDHDLYSVLATHLAKLLTTFDEERPPKQDAMSLTRMMWAFTQVDFSPPRATTRSLRSALRSIGCFLDSQQEKPSPTNVGRRSTLYEGDRDLAKPRVISDWQDRMVIDKPPGWRVDDDIVDDRLSRLSDYLAGGRVSAWPLLQDTSSQRGFMHRLDVPSSGLILLAKTYVAYYDLKLQLCCGLIVREYTTLCHGVVAQSRRKVQCRVHALSGQREATVNQAGKPALTWIVSRRAPVRHHDGSAYTLLEVRIGSGRTHQIRVHFSHIGNPTVCDGRYSSSRTLMRDAAWCPRNFLHRHRLVFQDASEHTQTVEVPLPTDLQAALSVIT